MSYHIAKHKDKLRYCITPDCKMVYEVCTDGKSKSICSLCKVALCRRCHVEYHAGVSCEIYQHYRGIDDELKKWICDDPSNRGLCPKCCIPIEKMADACMWNVNSVEVTSAGHVRISLTPGLSVINTCWRPRSLMYN